MIEAGARFVGVERDEAALALALEGASQPSGYTEPILHAAREKIKLASV